jgi:hypothetical protein
VLLGPGLKEHVERLFPRSVVHKRGLRQHAIKIE